MRLKFTHILKVCSLSLALVGTTAFVAAISFPDYAYAKNGNGGGNGNGNGNGGGQGAGKSDSGNSSNKSAGGNRSSTPKTNRNGGKKISLETLFGPRKKATTTRSTKTRTVKTRTQSTKTPTIKASTRPVTKPKGNKMARLLGVHPSELGALNAANANENALKNAAPGSRVGRIAAYRDKVLDGKAIESELVDKKGILDGLTPPTRPASEVAADLDAAIADAVDKQDLVDGLKTELADAGGADEAIEAELADAIDGLTTAQSEVDSLSAEQVAAAEYEGVIAEVEGLEDQLEQQPSVERTALEDAANKPVTDAVEAAVKSLLNL